MMIFFQNSEKKGQNCEIKVRIQNSGSRVHFFGPNSGP